MRFVEKAELLLRIDQLIKLKATGSPKDLAQRLNLSRSSIFNLINLMKSMGAEIDYCQSRRSYYYLKTKTLVIGFMEEKEYT